MKPRQFEPKSDRPTIPQPQISPPLFGGWGPRLS